MRQTANLPPWARTSPSFPGSPPFRLESTTLHHPRPPCYMLAIMQNPSNAANSICQVVIVICRIGSGFFCPSLARVFPTGTSGVIPCLNHLKAIIGGLGLPFLNALTRYLFPLAMRCCKRNGDPLSFHHGVFIRLLQVIYRHPSPDCATLVAWSCLFLSYTWLGTFALMS